MAALADAKITASQAPNGQIGVAASQKAEALAILEKKKLVPTTIQRLREEYGHASPWESPAERETRMQTFRMRKLEVEIGMLPEIASAVVDVNRGSTRPGLRSAGKVRAIVLAQSRQPRTPFSRTIRKVQAVVRSSEPDFPTMSSPSLDEAGHAYLVAGDPAAGIEMMLKLARRNFVAKFANAWLDPWRARLCDPRIPACAALAVRLLGESQISAPQSSESTAELESSRNRPLPIPPASPMPSRTLILVQVPIAHYCPIFRAKTDGRLPRMT